MVKKTARARPTVGGTVFAVATPLVAAGLVGPTFGAAAKFPGWEWGFYLGAGLLLAIAVLFQVLAKLRDRRQTADVITAREDLKLKLRDELLPFLSTVADMARVPFEQRNAYLKPVATQAVMVMRTLIEDHVDRLRANIYLLDADEQQMESLAHTGRGEKPKPFVAGTARGDDALEFAAKQETAFYPDLGRKKPVGYEGSMSGYKTFIAVPIWTESGSYGMVTLDAPQPKSFTAGDASIGIRQGE